MLDIIWLQSIHGAWNKYLRKLKKKILPATIDGYPEHEPDSGKKLDEIIQEAFIAGFSAGAQHVAIFNTGYDKYESRLN